MEEILPGIYLDGAHNEDGIEAFLSTVGRSACEGRRLLLFGVLADKSYETMIRKIADSELFGEVAGAVVVTWRSVSARELEGAFKNHEKIFNRTDKVFYKENAECLILKRN